MKSKNKNFNLSSDPPILGIELNDSSPERNLLASILLQAILDRRRWKSRLQKLNAVSQRELSPNGRVRLRASIKRLNLQIREVESYLFNPPPFDYFSSMENLCQLLDIDHELSRRALADGN
jgi:hypothetical protein